MEIIFSKSNPKKVCQNDHFLLSFDLWIKNSIVIILLVSSPIMVIYVLPTMVQK